MKTIPFVALLALLTLTSSYVSAVIATPTTTVTSLNDGFDHFRIHRQGATVALSWAVGAPGITRFVIERSYDGVAFETLQELPCNGNGTHKFNDESVYGGTYFYRITAVGADESTVQSAVESVRIVKRR